MQNVYSSYTNSKKTNVISVCVCVCADWWMRLAPHTLCLVGKPSFVLPKLVTAININIPMQGKCLTGDPENHHVCGGNLAKKLVPFRQKTCAI